jgi:hypothetical protein
MLRTYPPINDFILIRYKKPSLSPPPNATFTEEEKQTYLDSHESSFLKMVNQIRRFYPKTRIHVLTNMEDQPVSDLIYHKKNFWPDHTCKFLLYNLLDRPAMYIDTDILLLKPFQEKHMAGRPFNCFAISLLENLQEMSSKPLPVPVNAIYNAGLMWIAEPSQKIVDEITTLHHTYFSDQRFMSNHNKWSCVDEYALSLYIAINKLNMLLDDKTNVPRHRIQKPHRKYQSIHYTGIRTKELFQQEFDLLG